jgi:hypothetical protein
MDVGQKTCQLTPGNPNGNVLLTTTFSLGTLSFVSQTYLSRASASCSNFVAGEGSLYTRLTINSVVSNSGAFTGIYTTPASEAQHCEPATVPRGV